MSGKISVILLENIEGVGKAGDIVTVAEGYARNALFPDAKAAIATVGVQKKNKERDERERKSKEERLAQAQAVAERLEGTELLIIAKVKEGEDIFGSVTKLQIVDELNAQADLTLKPTDIVVPSPIKKLGTYDLQVMLNKDVEFTMKLLIVPETQPDEPDDE